MTSSIDRPENTGGRGVRTKTPERVAEAIRLREEGHLLREIGARLAISPKTAHAWITDPDGSKKAARMERYRVPCTSCGKPVSGCHGHRKQGERALCRPCAAQADAIWTREAIVLAIHEWADTHGGVPPTASDWNVRREDRAWPYPHSVIYAFGAWNLAIRASGFEPRAPGTYGRDGEDPAEVQRTVDLYRSGLTCAAIAAEFGITASGVRERLIKAGEPRRPAHRRRKAAA